MFLFHVGAQLQGKTAGESGYSQISRAFPVDNIKTQYGKLSAEYAKIGWYDKAVTVGFLAFEFGIGGVEKKANDPWAVAKLGGAAYDPNLPTKVGGESVPVEIAELDKSKANFDKAYLSLMAADKKLAGSPNSKESAQEYLLAYAKYIQTGFDLQSRVSHFDQSGLKGVVNGITFALDAATAPLLAVGAGEIVTGAKLAFQQGFKLAARQALKAMPKSFLSSAGYAGLETGSAFFEMDDSREAGRKFMENAPETLGKFRLELLKMKAEATREGRHDIAMELGKAYDQAFDLSVKLQAKEIADRELVRQFGYSMAIGIVMSAALSSGGKAAKSSEIVDGFVKTPTAKAKLPVVKETITKGMHAPDMPKIKDEKMLIAYLDGQGSKGKVAYGSGRNQIEYTTVDPQMGNFGIKLHIAVPGGADKDLGMVAALYKKMMIIADEHRFNFKFVNRMTGKERPDQAGKDFTLYFNDLKTYNEALGDLKSLSNEIKVFNKNKNLDDHLVALNKANDGTGKINMMGEMPIEGADYLRGQVRSHTGLDGIAVPESYFAGTPLTIDASKGSRAFGIDIPAVMKKDNYLIFNDKVLDGGTRELTAPVWNAYQEGQVKVWNYSRKAFD